MADRDVTVKLKADISQFSRSLATAAAEAKALGGSLGGINGPLATTEKQTKSTSNEIDKLSGRLRVMTDLALIAGPALVPLGAAAVGGLVAMSGQLAATAGALGVTLLAVQGLGDGLKALDAYQLDPTAAHLQKLRGELESLGPAGRDFVYFLDSIEPQLKALQNTAHEGLLPGAETGIKELLTLGTKFRSVIKDISTELGGQLSNAGTALAGPKFEAFFNYLQTDAQPILHDMGHTIGNLTEAAANMFVAFGGVSTDFGGGLLKFSEKLAEASRNLDTNQGFQQFLDYIETEGPHALDTLGSMADAILQIVEATAPLGGPVLTILGKVADIFAAIADSDLGTPIFAGLAALALYNRTLALTGKIGETSFGKVLLGEQTATAGLLPLQTKVKTLGTDLLAVGRYGKLATESSGRLGDQLKTVGRSAGLIGGLALASSGLADGMGLSNTASLALVGTLAGPWGAAVGAGVGYALDFKAANDKAGDSVTALSDALRANQGDFAAQQIAIDDARASAAAMADDIKSNSVGEFFKNAFDPDVAVAFTRSAFGMKTADEQLAAAADDAQKSLNGQESGAVSLFNPVHALSTAFLDNAAAATEQAQAVAASEKAMQDEADAAVNAFDAITQYRQALKDAAAQAKKNNAGIQGNSDAVLENRAKLSGLVAAWNGLDQTVTDNIHKFKAARDNFIATAEGMGVSKAAATALWREMAKIPSKKVIPTSTPGMDDAISKAKTLSQILASLHSKDINIALHYQTIGNRGPTGGGPLPGGQPQADGGTIGGARHPYGDKVLSMLAPGEEVISNRHGQADRFRADRAAGRIPGYANGGTAGSTYTSMLGGGNAVAGVQVWTSGVYSIAKALKAFKAELDAASKSVDKEKQARDDLISAEQSFMQSVAGAYSKADLFAGGLSDFDTGLSANINDTQAAQAALATAASHGLNGPLYQALAASGNLSLLQEFAGLSSDQIGIREQQFAAQSNAQSTLGASTATAAGFTQAIKDQTKELKEAQRERKHLAAAVKSLEDKLPGKVEDGARKGIAERDKRTHQRVRTGS